VVTVDLYQELGLNRGAEHEAVKAAYRACAKREHPDRGGDAERFDRIQRAYDVLSDPQRRARYDATGEVDDSSAMGEEQEAVSLLQRLIMGVVFGKTDLTRNDLIGATLAAGGAAREQLAAKTAEIEANLARIATVRERLCWTGAQGSDLISRLLDQQERELRLSLPRVERALRVNDAAMKMLKNYAYRVDADGASMSFIHGEDGLSVRISRAKAAEVTAE
jgi:curved DNA-binding protein CbpA